MKLKVVVMTITALTSIVASQPRLGHAYSGEKFEIKGSGTLVHLEAALRIAGQKPPTTAVNAAAIINCIIGTTPDCAPGNNVIENDSAGKAYICFESDTVFSLSTDINFGTRTTLQGLAGGNGTFAMAGEHTLSDTQFVIKGKVKLASGTLTPLGIPSTAPATILAVSDSNEHYATGTFRTVGISLGTCP